MLTSTHKNHITSIQNPSHIYLPEKSCLHSLKILIMSWLFKDPVVTMKEIMSWLFKDPINSDLAQFYHAQSKSKKWPKGYKDQIAPNELFPWKTTNKIFMHLLGPYTFCKIFKKFLEPTQSYEMCHFQVQNGPFVPKNFFWFKPFLLVSSTYWHFSLCKI